MGGGGSRSGAERKITKWRDQSQVMYGTVVCWVQGQSFESNPSQQQDEATELQAGCVAIRGCTGVNTYTLIHGEPLSMRSMLLD